MCSTAIQSQRLCSMQGLWVTELVRPGFRCPVTAYMHAEQPMSSSQHMCLEFPSRNPPSPSEKSAAELQQDNRGLVHVSAEKNRELASNKGAYLWSDAPCLCQKWVGFFPQVGRHSDFMTKNSNDKRQHVYQNSKFHLQHPLNLQMHFCN